MSYNNHNWQDSRTRVEKALDWVICILLALVFITLAIIGIYKAYAL